MPQPSFVTALPAILPGTRLAPCCIPNPPPTPGPSLVLSRRSCKRSPYHYVAKCEDVVRLGREWSLWLTEGKSVFLQAVAVQGDEHKALLLQHQRRKQEHDRAMHEVFVTLSFCCYISFVFFLFHQQDSALNQVTYQV